jgi:hypothetical protein
LPGGVDIEKATEKIEGKVKSTIEAGVSVADALVQDAGQLKEQLQGGITSLFGTDGSTALSVMFQNASYALELIANLKLSQLKLIIAIDLYELTMIQIEDTGELATYLAIVDAIPSSLVYAKEELAESLEQLEGVITNTEAKKVSVKALVDVRLKLGNICGALNGSNKNIFNLGFLVDDIVKAFTKFDNVLKEIEALKDSIEKYIDNVLSADKTKDALKSLKNAKNNMLELINKANVAGEYSDKLKQLNSSKDLCYGIQALVAALSSNPLEINSLLQGQPLYDDYLDISSQIQDISLGTETAVYEAEKTRYLAVANLALQQNYVTQLSTETTKMKDAINDLVGSIDLVDGKLQGLADPGSGAAGLAAAALAVPLASALKDALFGDGVKALMGIAQRATSSMGKAADCTDKYIKSRPVEEGEKARKLSEARDEFLAIYDAEVSATAAAMHSTSVAIAANDDAVKRLERSRELVNTYMT